jgi:hypothetical protein
VGGKRVFLIDEPEQHPALQQLPRPVPLVHLVPPTESHPGTLVQLRSSLSSNLLSCYLLPGQRYLPPEYPPRGVPLRPSRVSSQPGKRSQQRPSTRSNRLERGAICFLPGAGRHSLSLDRIILTSPRAQTPGSSESVSSSGKLTLHHPSTETLLLPFVVEGIEEEGLRVGCGSSSIDGSTTTEALASVLQSPPPTRGSTPEGERVGITIVIPRLASLRSTTGVSAKKDPCCEEGEVDYCLTDEYELKKVSTRRGAQPPISGRSPRTLSLGAFVSEQFITPPIPRTPIPIISENGADEALAQNSCQRRNGTSTLALNLPETSETSCLPIRNMSSYHSLREQRSQTFLSISSRSGSSVALVEDEPKERSRGSSFSRKLPGS